MPAEYKQNDRGHRDTRTSIKSLSRSKWADITVLSYRLITGWNMTAIKRKIYLWCAPVRLHLWRSRFLRVILSLCAVGLVACEQAGSLVLEPQYASELLGSWEGTVSGQLETIRFDADGSFTARSHQTGFINTTLGQGVVGSIDGRWELDGKVIKLVIEGAENVQPLNLSTTSNIVSFNQNKLVMNSAGAGNATFLRVLN